VVAVSDGCPEIEYDDLAACAEQCCAECGEWCEEDEEFCEECLRGGNV
jgi:hypothetical protein